MPVPVYNLLMHGCCYVVYAHCLPGAGQDYQLYTKVLAFFKTAS